MNRNILVDAIEKSRVTVPTVLVIGDLMLDRYVWGSVDRISPEAPVPVVKVNSESEALGGAGNVVANLIAMRSHVKLVSTCGYDEAATRIRNLLDEYETLEKFLVSLKYARTTQKTRIVSQGQHIVRIDHEDEMPLEDSNIDILRLKSLELLEDVDVCILSDYGKGICVEGLIKPLIEKCKQLSIPVLVDSKGKNFEIYRNASCITPNVNELPIDLDREDESDICRVGKQILSQYQIDNIVITRGYKGMSLVTPSSTFHIHSQERQVYDVSGAGDTVISALAKFIGCGLDYKTASHLSNYAGGLAVEKVGTCPVGFEEIARAVTNEVLSTYEKTYDPMELYRLVMGWRQHGSSIVFTNGCFDLLHPGHIYLLEEASKFGDKLVVAINSDQSIKRIKGKGRPINTQEDRAVLISSLSCVDAVTIFGEDTPIDLIENLRPDVLIKGSDYSISDVVGGGTVKEYGGKVELIPLKKGKSTTKLIEKITNI